METAERGLTWPPGMFSTPQRLSAQFRLDTLQQTQTKLIGPKRLGTGTRIKVKMKMGRTATEKSSLVVLEGPQTQDYFFHGFHGRQPREKI